MSKPEGMVRVGWVIEFTPSGRKPYLWSFRGDTKADIKSEFNNHRNLGRETYVDDYKSWQKEGRLRAIPIYRRKE